MPYTPDEIVLATVRRIHTKAIAALLPIRRDMQIMGWEPDLQAAMWLEIADIAMDRMGDAEALAKDQAAR